MNNNFKNICQKFNASIIQKLYKKITDENGDIVNKDVFPAALVQSIYDAISGMRLDDILSHYNYINIEYKGSEEATRLAIPIAHRRASLIISYKNYEGETVIEQYVGDTINDKSWKSTDNWKTPFKEGIFNVHITDEQLALYIDNYLDSRDFSTIINESITNNINNNFNEYLNSEEIVDLFKSIINEFLDSIVQQYLGDILTEERVIQLIQQYLEDNINDILINFFNTEEGNQYITNAINNYLQEIIGEDFDFSSYLEELVGEYFESIKKYVQDNERVIANALARHEQAINDLQNS